MTVTSKDITNYLDYLKSTGLFITLHGKIISNSKFLEYNYHYNPYCLAVKQVFRNWETCISCQEKVEKKCSDGAFFGSCYAGVGEFIYPIVTDGMLAGFVSVSGYVAEDSTEKATALSEKLRIPPKEILEIMHRNLSSRLPGKENLDTVIHPLIFMLEGYCKNLFEKAGKDDLLYHQILYYISNNYHKKITMADLSQRFHYSISTLSPLFSRYSGQSLPEYIAYLRIEEAKWHLTHTNVSITELAHYLGFSSSNYFSMVFKEKCGVTPSSYRAANRTESKQ